MKYASDFRYHAREALKGKWSTAVVAGLIATLLGAIGSDGPEVKLDVDMSGVGVNLAYAGRPFFSTNGGVAENLGIFFAGRVLHIVLAAIVMAALFFIVGSVVEVGYARFHLDLADGREGKLKSLFAYFCNWKTTALSRLLQTLYVCLWSLLCLFTFGIGNLWLTPYRQAAVAAFYREISGSRESVTE